ncbi:CoA transferase [Pseudofrankia sp. BMG5.37]|uniref:CaiB/BaiF CoA-transferase family protein n=1 Tax=Pseudofrankia sp. BMG5.37 TaxID=3050035 RepID=UPI0028949A42|nr:CoA transferase [Pseudofrankia sp. BMG5.37]MDT3441962.1 CoA transferase [Pseudofrankia sp. BMG5.37]
MTSLSTSTLRVLDLTDDLAFQAARLLVGLGADVIRVTDRPAVPLGTADHLHWHAGKRVCRSADLETVLVRLLPDADIVLESGPVTTLRTLGLRDADPDAWSRVSHVVVTPFGLTGPRSTWLADDLVATAAGGMAWLGGDPGQAPQPPPRQQATQLAGTHAAIAALLGLVARRRTGRGQLADLSVQEAVAATLETGAISWIHAGTVPGRTSGVYGHVAHRVFAASDGYLAGGYSGSNRMWDDLLAWMDEQRAAEDLTEPRWQDPVLRWERRPHVDDVVGRFVARHTAEDFSQEARRRSLPWAEIVSPARLLENPQLRDREFLVDIETSVGRVADVGFPFASRALPRPVRLDEPQHVGADVRWLDGPEASPHGPPRIRRRLVSNRPGDDKAGGAPGQALDGVRVLDLTWVLAGPYMTKILGEHGADIIKVESAHRQDPTRFAPSMRLRPGASHDDSGYFINFNRDKRSLALNLRKPRAQEILRRLAAEVDVVVENFSPGVLARWGLAYPELSKINPDVILVSMAGVGQTGPWRPAVTFADTLAAMSGLTYETGGEGRAPQGLTFGLGDMVAANAAALAALELLYAGHGGHVDLSQLEAMAAQLGPALVESRLGGTRRHAVLPDVFRTRGDDRWIAIGSAAPELLTTALKIEREADEHTDFARMISTAVAERDADELAAQLQQLGVPAYPVRDGRDLVEADEQLAARGFYVDLEHPLVGKVAHEGVVAHLSETPGAIRRPAPLLGQHTDELLVELLGLGPDELRTLHDEGALE